MGGQIFSLSSFSIFNISFYLCLSLQAGGYSSIKTWWL